MGAVVPSSTTLDDANKGVPREGVEDDEDDANVPIDAIFVG